jgi:hypothetical protein
LASTPGPKFDSIATIPFPFGIILVEVIANYLKDPAQTKPIIGLRQRPQHLANTRITIRAAEGKENDGFLESLFDTTFLFGVTIGPAKGEPKICKSLCLAVRIDCHYIFNSQISGRFFDFCRSGYNLH